MSPEEIQRILKSARPNGADRQDADVAAALQEAAAMPELAQWQADEEAFDRAFSEKLSEAIQPPENLQERIFVAVAEKTARAAMEAPESDAGKVVQLPWWRSAGTMSMAAALVMLFALMAFFMNPNPVAAGSSTQLNAFYDMAAEKVVSGFQPTYQDKDLNALNERLREQQAPHLGDTAAQLRGVEGLACMSFRWEGKPVGIVCIDAGSPFHVFILNRADMPKCDPPGAPVFEQRGDLALAKWSDQDNIYVMVGRGTIETARGIL